MSMQQPTLRPFNAGEILDRAFRLYRAHFWLFIGIGGVVLGPMLILKLLSQLFFHDARIVSIIESLFIAYGMLGAMIWAAANYYLGKPVTFSDSYSVSGRHIGKFFVANFIQGLAYLPVIAVFAILFIAILAAGRTTSITGVIAVVGFLFMLVIAIPYLCFFSTRWWFSLPAIMLEDLNSIDGLKRSWALTNQSFWRVFGVVVATGLLSYVISAAPAVIIVYLIQMFPAFREISLFSALVIDEISSLIMLPLSASILVIAYYDMRVRREGFDLQLELETLVPQPEITDGETSFAD